MTLLLAERYAGALKAALSLGVILMAASIAMAQPFAGLPPVRPVPLAGGFGFRGAPHPGLSRFGGLFAYPLFLGDYDYGYPGYAPAPNVVIVQQPPAYVVLQNAPSAAPSGEIHEYAPAPSSAPTDSTEESPAFAIVLKDGSVRSAVAVAAQNDSLHYVDLDGRHQHVALETVDRAATRKRNRENHLELQLPPSEK